MNFASGSQARHADTASQGQYVALLDEQDPFDWGDLRASGDRADALLERLAGDPQMLRALLTRVSQDDTLLSMCERHRPFDKIVLYDGGDRNFRIRLHIWRNTEFERAHQHRFSFTSRLLQGHYRHVLYDCPRPAWSGEARNHMDPEHPDPSSGIDLARIRPVLEYEMKAGDSYTLHHDAVHATLVQADTVSLILRGPAEKDVAFVANLEAGGVYWRFGRRDEDQTRIRAKQLTRDELTGCVTDLQSRGILV
ncbi:hypothetical protein ABZY09_07925 [Streptomyces sp. NPDC002928]|uniref:hypothetical protein n=1 Tax=Streptomyces sp. NPDC002928 TaxID=3154440 RepID=UPI0033B86AA8